MRSRGARAQSANIILMQSMPVHPVKSEQKLGEHARLLEAREGTAPWRQWGPYLSERQWGTVREDYSEDGTAWDYFPHDHARSRAYRWGEDGLAGFCDDKQLLCFALALWNGSDPILKERAFGLTNGEGNHGEDVKESYFYLDATPTYSYCKYLYKYPQRTFPYDDLVRTNRARSRQELEYELIDSGIFDNDHYFDVIVEYGKASPEDILILLTVHNRGPAAKPLHLLPTLWFRNLWSGRPDAEKPTMTGDRDTITADHTASWWLATEMRWVAATPFHRERDKRSAHLRHRQRNRLCQGRHQRLPAARPY